MGMIRMGPPEFLLRGLASSFPQFVETGTYEGETLMRAREIFARTYSVELSPLYYERAVRKYGQITDVVLCHGESPAVLSGLRESGVFETPTVFWLDAHWSGGSTAGIRSQCPLMGELTAIISDGRNALSHVILIDDARLFTSLPYLHRKEDWPNLLQIVDAVRDRGAMLYVFDDIIAIFPNSCAGRIDAIMEAYEQSRRKFLVRNVIRVHRLMYRLALRCVGLVGG